MDCYRAIEAASQQMLEAAQMADWNEVVRYEGACGVLIEHFGGDFPAWLFAAIAVAAWQWHTSWTA